MTQVQDVDKQTLSDFLTFIETTLQKHWADHDCFIDLQERILVLRMILEEAGDSTDESTQLSFTIVWSYGTFDLRTRPK